MNHTPIIHSMNTNRIAVPVVRENPFTGETVVKEIVLDPKDLLDWENGKGNIQDILHYLSADDREFIMTGIGGSQWDDLFGAEPDCDDSDEYWSDHDIYGGGAYINEEF